MAELVIPGTVKVIDGCCLCYTGLKKLIIEYGVETIECWGIHNCYYLETLVIPDSVTFIHYYAFMNCYNLK